MFSPRRLVAGLAAVAVIVCMQLPSAYASSPTVTVKTRPAYTQNPIAFVARHLGPRAWWRLEMHNPSPAARTDDEIKLGLHQANAYGVIRFTHKAVGMKGAHFNGKPYEVWLVNLIEPHPVGNEPGPFSTVFRMYRGCGCGSR